MSVEQQAQERRERLQENLRALNRNVTIPQAYRPLIEPGTYGPELGLRTGTRMHRYLVNFAFNEGGMGDYINYSASLVWLAKNSPWIDGRLFVSNAFVPLFQEIFRTHGVTWEVIKGENAGQSIEPGTPIIGPEIKVGGTNVNPQLLNPIGAHLIDLGFAYYANRCPAPPDVTLPRISFARNRIPHALRHLNGKYICIPTGAMTPSRFLSGDHINPLTAHIKEAGFTPVFLGKKTATDTIKAVFADDINYEIGMDLREQTDVLGAAAIMHHSAGVVGLDNGLLHLAACTDAPVLFGYSIAGPDQRQPRRNWSSTWNFSVSPEELACANCQSHLKVVLGHTFHKCLYGDNRCIDILFLEKQQLWKDALTECFVLWEAKPKSEEPS